jgi:dynamin 1-like protein
MAALGEELLSIVNRLQDLVFNTIGNDSLDLPQIVRFPLSRRKRTRDER